MFNFLKNRKKDDVKKSKEEHQENKYLQQKEYNLNPANKASPCCRNRLEKVESPRDIRI